MRLQLYYGEKETLLGTDKKDFPISNEIQMGSVAKSYMRNIFLIYEEMENI